MKEEAAVAQGRIIKLIMGVEGSVALISAAALLGLVAVASLAIDMGRLYTVRNEMQNTADSAALAAANSLIVDQGGVAVRDSYGATQSAMNVAQRQAELQGLPAASQEDRNDLAVVFGEWNLYAGNPETAWTEIGTSCGSYSNANAVRVTLQRAAGINYGPVTNLFAGFLGVETSEVRATATAYLGYTNEVQPAGVQVPLAVPDSILTACRGNSDNWFARLFGPKEAMASTTTTLVFKDTGGSQVDNNVPTSPAAALDSGQPYWYTVGANDAIPDTMKNILTRVYTPGYTASTPVVVGDLKVGQQIYPRSEYPWGRSYIGPLFQKLQQAYNAKKGTYDNQRRYQNPSGMWRTTLAVFVPKTTAFLPGTGFKALARLLAPFWPSEALACSTMNPPAVVVGGFVNVDITSVSYNSSSSDDGSYTYPKTINRIKYNNKKDFLRRYPSSTWNLNSVTIQNVTDASTVSPPGSVSGGPPAEQVNNGAPGNVGALATVAKLVK
jgi:Flp pilus assembly protein TadG